MKNKEIKIEDSAIERLRGIYPEMNEGQLYEIALGEAEGLDFSSYADAAFTAEYMKKKREEISLLRHRAIALFECRYFYGTMKYLDALLSTRETLFEALAEEKMGVTYADIERWASSDGQLQGKMNKVYEALLKDKSVNDIFDDKDARLPEKYAKLISGMRIEDTTTATTLSFPITVTSDVYKTFGKGGFDKNEGVGVTPDTKFVVKNKLSSYADAYFSVALNSKDFSVAVAARPNRSAIKSSADIAVVILDGDSLWYDNAAKYTDVTLLVKGLRS